MSPLRICDRVEILRRLTLKNNLWLFLDYDGTLAEFADTPQTIIPDQNLIRLISGLSKLKNIRIAVISGRRLTHIQTLLPIRGIWLAGVYGIEIQTPEGKQILQLEDFKIQNELRELKPHWERLAKKTHGSYIEDKGWSLAVHAARSDDQEADELIRAAAKTAELKIDSPILHLVGGYKFLEIAPRIADKSRTVRYILENHPWEGAQLAIFGDDDKDEPAFEFIKNLGGTAVLVSNRPRISHADCYLKSPAQLREVLKYLLEARLQGVTKLQSS